ncbi:hypothetical protein EHQ16_00755 [Leptospira kanakyensis]|uniref:Lipoprotein n=1 Tax=Leptospira kanakyensis TaxID=2484968 RepID=A0A6N4Q7H2_9LEPT|nr:hypothetical protein [Leptospira kanakyensis]TGK47961.1 hypothetical protein EHQ11_18830 [Leptospira kanakyensis]TGK63031.1 hypothetical protein EHQ16_00755 [Leptospira kanakyensis]TGK66637.1 hypothetical protein EHQ18_15990 [Leptospira kanakyensis]
MKLFLNVNLVFIFTFILSCNLHYFSLAKKNSPSVHTNDTSMKGKIRFNLIRSEEGGKTNLYNSSVVEYELAKSKLFVLSKTSKLDLTYTTTTGYNHAGISVVLFLITFGVFPSFEESHSSVTFTIYDKENRTIIRDYTYPIRGRRIISWLTIPFYIVLPIVSKSFDGGGNDAISNASIRLLVEAFETDFVNDCKENPLFLEKMLSLSRDMIEL